MLKIARVAICAVVWATTLVGCGGTESIGSGSGGTSTPTTPTDPAVPTTPVYRIGVLNGTTFSPGVIQISNSNLSAGGSSGVRVDIVDTANNNAPVAMAVTVTFNSPCVSDGRSSISQNPVVAAAGTASTNYNALGCSGTDTVTATATVGSSALSASGTINVQASPPSTITFLKADPTSIALRGSGRSETSVISFKVLNAVGGPASNQSVVFSLDTSVGGLSLSPTQGVTNSDGIVTTTVRSGTVQTSVTVKAAVANAPNIIPAQSDSLVVSTGIADQDSLSLSIGCFNIEGNNYDNVMTNVNVLASDRFNNPVPDGTALAFRAEGGSIDSKCFTAGGGCSVQFRSQNPRTADHRISILATGIGEESFTDMNGDGRYSRGESFLDLPEAFVDNNENGMRDADEAFIDYNSNGAYDGPNGSFTGVLCDSGCDTSNSLLVRGGGTIIMSGSQATISISPGTIDLSKQLPVQVTVLVQDDAGQPMPGQSTIAASTTLGAIVAPATVTQPCTAQQGPGIYTFVVNPPDAASNPPPSGSFVVRVTTPKGVITSSDPVFVNFSSSSTPPPPPPSSPLGAVQFVDATPTIIGVRGGVLGETSSVTFRVLSQTGAPIEGQVVSFNLSTRVGGLDLTPTSATSDSDGRVSTIVRSGTVATTVQVSANATQGSTSVQGLSARLVVSTGIPDQNSFSLSANTLNVEGDSLDGNKATLAVRLADRFNNPVPDNTAVSFTTEGGRVVGQCFTVGGDCTSTFNSQNPRNPTHRYTILASVIGEESFIDLNGDGRFDQGEPFENLGEPFLDANEDGVRDPTNESFLDFNSDGTYQDKTASSTFTGVLCDSNCDASSTLFAQRSLVMVMSSSAATVKVTPDPIIVATGGDAVDVTVTIADTANQPMAGGTAVDVRDSSNTVQNVNIFPAERITLPGSNNNGPDVLRYTITPSSSITATQSSNFVATITSASGVISTGSARLLKCGADLGTFGTQNPVPQSTLVVSNSIGVNAGACPNTVTFSISVTNGEYSIDNGPFTATSARVNGGASVRVRHTSASSANATTDTVLSVGADTATFRSVTN